MALPGRMRVDHPGRRVDLWIEGTGWRCEPGKPAERMAGDALARLDTLRQHVRALLL